MISTDVLGSYRVIKLFQLKKGLIGSDGERIYKVSALGRTWRWIKSTFIGWDRAFVDCKAAIVLSTMTKLSISVELSSDQKKIINDKIIAFHEGLKPETQEKVKIIFHRFSQRISLNSTPEEKPATSTAYFKQESVVGVSSVPLRSTFDAVSFCGSVSQSKIDLRLDVKIKTLIGVSRESLMAIHCAAMGRRNTPAIDSKLLVNIFGLRIFGGKVNRSDIPLDGVGSEDAIYRFLEGLSGYAQTLADDGSMTEEMAAKFECMIDEHMMFYCSALIRRSIKLSEGDLTMAARAAENLTADVDAVMIGVKTRGAWLSGGADHFVPFRYESVRVDGRPYLRMSFFNLGSGSHVPVNGSEAKNEIRLGEEVVDNEGHHYVLCSSKFLRYLKDENFFKNIVWHSAMILWPLWSELICSYIPESIRPGSPRAYESPLLQSVMIQRVQQIGDCACRGQWAMMFKGFDRLGLSELYDGFEDFLKDMTLKRFARATRLDLPIQLTYAQPTGMQLSDADIYQLCLMDKMSATKAELEKSRSTIAVWKDRIICLPILDSDGRNVIMPLGRLFQGKNRVIIGRWRRDFEDQKHLDCLRDSSLVNDPDNAAVYSFDFGADTSMSMASIELSIEDEKLYVRRLSAEEVYIINTEYSTASLDADRVEVDRQTIILCCQDISRVNKAFTII